MNIVEPNRIGRKGPCDPGADNKSNSAELDSELAGRTGHSNLVGIQHVQPGDDAVSAGRADVRELCLADAETSWEWEDVGMDQRGPICRPFEDDAKAAVQSWQPICLGRRPRDFLARDLLLNSLWRDERPRLFHSMSKKPPIWIEDHVHHLPIPQQQQATHLTALHYLHRRQLTRMWTGGFDDWEMNIDGRRVLEALGSCWPYGAQYALPENVTDDHRGHACRLAWLCPWCYARRAVRLYDLLRNGPLRERRGKYVVLAWLSTYGEQAGPDRAWGHSWKGRCNVGDYYLPTRERMRRLRRVTFAKLRRFAVDLGIAGGIVAHQISPDRTTSWRRGIPSGLASFRHDYTMLGEVSFRSESELKALRERIDFDSYPHAVIYVNNPNLAPAYSQIRLFWSFHPADDPSVDALRLFLAGSSTDYPLQNLEMYAGGMTSGCLMRSGVRGALAVEPHFMMDQIQWWSYAEAMRGLPLYVPFGSWRTSIGQAKKDEVSLTSHALSLPSPQRRVAWHRNRALKSANAQRKQKSLAELANMLEVARPLVQKLGIAPTGKKGRPAKRARLRELLDRAGYAVSDHHLKKLMTALRSPSKPVSVAV